MQTSPLLDTDVAIETPEHVVLHYRLAGPARRLPAYLLDLLICYTALVAAAAIVLLASAGSAAVAGAAQDAFGAGIGLLFVLLFAIQWVYFASLEAWRGTTPGKAAFGLRVVTTGGRPISLRAAVLRNVLRAADALPLAYAAGCLSIAALASMSATRRFQRLGDLVAGTMVVIPERAGAAAPVMLSPPAQPCELVDLPERVHLDPDERQAIEMFLRRRERLGRARELELATMIAPLLGARFGSRPHPDPSRALGLFFERREVATRADTARASKAAG